MDTKKYGDQVFKIIGAAMAVHRNLGEGLLEPIYNEAMVMELADRGITGEPEKSVQRLIPAHRAQLFNYLRLTRKPIGLLINFGTESLQGERYAYNEETNTCYLLDRNMEPVPTEERDIDEVWYEDPYADVRK